MKNFKQSKGGYASTLALAFALMSTPQALAQSNAGQTDTGASTLDEVIVTARKREETLIEVPISVAAFSQGDLDKLGITNAEALSQSTPSFDFQNVGTGGQSGRANPQIRFRGIGLQISDPNAPSAAIFWDGVYVPQGIGLVPLVDLEQVEVIKGPQTAFFGRNTFAGAANFIPATPKDGISGRVSAEGSKTDVDTGYAVNGTLNAGLSENFRARLTLSTEKTPASHEYADGSPLGEENTDAVLGSIDFDLNDNITLSYTGYFVDAEDTSSLSSQNASDTSCDLTYDGTLQNIVTGEDLGSFTTDLSVPGGNFPFGPFFNVNNPTTSTLFCGEVPEWNSTNQINPAFGGAPSTTNAAFVTNTTLPAGTSDIFSSFVDAPGGLGNTYETWRNKFSVAAEIGSGFTLDAFISNGRFKNWGTFDSQYGAGAVPSYAGFINNNEDESAEIRITSPTENTRLRYSFGVNYQAQEGHQFQTGFDILTSIESKTIGIFGAADYDITNELTISGEGRWQDDDSKLLQDGSPGAAFAEQSQDFSKFMPRVILSYQPEGRDLNVYGSWSQSYIAGNQTGATSYAAALLNDLLAFDPTATAADTGFDADAAGFFTPIQKLDAFEIGLKHQLNSQLSYSIAAYQMDWQNQVFFVLSPTFVSLAQPGDSEYTGVEAEIEYNPSDWLSLQAGFNYVDGTFTNYIATGSVAGAVLAPGLLNNTTAIVANGNQVRYNPATTGTFSAEVALDNVINLDSFLRVDANYTGKFFIDNFEYNQVGAATRINLRAGAQINDTFGVEIFGTNVTDNLTPTTQGGTTFTSFFSQNTRRFFGQVPRGAEYGVKVIATF